MDRVVAGDSRAVGRSPYGQGMRDNAVGRICGLPGQRIERELARIIPGAAAATKSFHRDPEEAAASRAFLTGETICGSLFWVAVKRILRAAKTIHLPHKAAEVCMCRGGVVFGLSNEFACRARAGMGRRPPRRTAPVTQNPSEHA